MPRCLACAARGTAELGAQIDDGGDGDAGVGKVECRLIGAVVVGQDDGALARQSAEAVDVGAGGIGQHDAGPVVVGEHQGAFVRAGRQHDLFGADLPQALTRDLGRRAARQVVGAALRHDQVVVVVVAGDGGARQQANFGEALQLLDRVADPVGGRAAIDGFT